MQMRSVFVEPPLWQNVIRCSNREIDVRDFKQRRFKRRTSSESCLFVFLAVTLTKFLG